MKGLRRLDKLTQDTGLFGNLDEVEALDAEQLEELKGHLQRVQMQCARLAERLMARAGEE